MSPAPPPADPRQHWRAIATRLLRLDVSTSYIVGNLAGEGCPEQVARQIIAEIRREQNPTNRAGGFGKLITGGAMLLGAALILLLLYGLGQEHVIVGGRAVLLALGSLALGGAWLVFRGLVQFVLG